MMNNIKYLLIILVAVFIYSCTEDDFDTPPAPPSYNNIVQELTDTIDNNNAVLLKENESNTWDTLSWTPAVLYEGQGLTIHYAVQIADSGSNFNSYIEIESNTTTDTSIVISVGELNTALLATGYNPVETYKLELRIKAHVHPDLESLYTNGYPFTVRTYKDIADPDELYLFGDATAVGWGADTSLAFIKDGDVFVKFAYLENNKKFRFLKAQNTDDNTYSYSSIVNIPSNVSVAGDDDDNFLFTGTTGWYKIDVNYLSSTLNISAYENNSYTYQYDYDKLYVVGSISGWDAQADPPSMEMTKISEGVFSRDITIPDDAEFKFVLGNGQWSPNWANIKEKGNSGIIGPEGYNDNIAFDGGGKTYRLVVDLKRSIYTLTEIKTLPQEIWLVGSVNGWNNHGQYLAARGNDVHVGYQYLEDNSEIKILVERDSWDGLWGAGTTAGEIADGGGNIVVSQLPDYTTPGFYEIKFDLLNKTVELTEVAFGVIGDAQAGEWSTDADLTYNQTTKVWEGQVTFFDTGSYKFRANDDWGINLGGTLDNLVHGGDNIASPGAGTYNVILDISGADKFFATVTAK